MDDPAASGGSGGSAERKSLIAIIPARGGSKGLPGKNIALLAGRPLIAYTIDAARESGVFDAICVSTDCPAIKAAALAAGAEVVDRPPELAADASSSASCVIHALDAHRGCGREFHALCLLQPTSPLRTAAHIRDSVAIFAAHPEGSVISVCEETHPPFKSFTLAGGALTPLFDAARLSAPRQSLPVCYRQNGAVYLVRTADMRDQQSFYVAPCRPYVMPEAASVDIDLAADLRLCEFWLRQ
jgi:CMP-N-acetylneuraminic acid synthetase